MKKVSFVIAFVAMILSVSMPLVAEAESKFSDVNEGEAHYESIHWMASDEINGISGYKDGRFGTDESLTREHAAKIFTNLLDLDLPDEGQVTDQFIDIKSSEYAREITAVAEADIMNGHHEAFRPDDKLSRQQMASTLVKALELVSEGNVADTVLQGVDPVHQPNVQILADLGITENQDNFRPAQETTRGQFATFLYRSVEGSDHDEPSDPEPSPSPTPDEGAKVNIETERYNQNFQVMLNQQMNLTTRPQTGGSDSWFDGSEGVAAYYLNPSNFDEDTDGFYQFLKLSGSSGVSAAEFNRSILEGKGILTDQGNAFRQASQQYNVNDIYLISHAILESGNGKSKLAQGVEVGKDEEDEVVQATEKNRDKLTDIKTTYNVYGIGAVDECPLECGSETAYEKGWFTPEEAIIGGAEYIGKNYISSGQDTLYKMRWNPDAPATHQYATDAGWAVKQTTRIKDMFERFKDVDGHVMNFEVPAFKDQPKSSVLPTGLDVFHEDKEHESVGKTAMVTADALNMREGPSTQFRLNSKIDEKTKVTILAENQDWYKVRADAKDGWVSGDYLDFDYKETDDEQTDDEQKDDKHTKVPSTDPALQSEEVSPDIMVEHRNITLP